MAQDLGPPLDFGPHSAAVMEVIDFVESGGVLSGHFDPVRGATAGFDLLIVDSLVEIERYRDPWEDNARIGDHMWHADIKRVDNRAYYFKGYTSEPTVYTALSPVFASETARLLRLLDRQLRGFLPKEEIETIADDMEVLMRSRAAIGISRILPERLFDVYRSGGYACGWEGTYPEGRLVVFSR